VVCKRSDVFSSRLEAIEPDSVLMQGNGVASKHNLHYHARCCLLMYSFHIRFHRDKVSERPLYAVKTVSGKLQHSPYPHSPYPNIPPVNTCTAICYFMLCFVYPSKTIALCVIQSVRSIRLNGTKLRVDTNDSSRADQHHADAC